MSLLVPLFANHFTDVSYSLPLIVAVSLVYSATRSERMQPILAGALRFSIWVIGFMAIAFAILYFLSSGL